MQGDELLPGDQNVLRRSVRPRAPDRLGGDRSLDPLQHLAELPVAQFRPQGFWLKARGVVGGMRGDVDQGGFEVFGPQVAELQRTEFLEMVVQQPGVVDRRLQNEGFAGRHRGARTAMQRACRHLL